MAPTFWAVIIGNGHISVQGNSDDTTLGWFELIAIQLHCKGVRQYDMMSDAENMVESIRGERWSEWTYIHGSVDESPSGDLVRSLVRPGAKSPRPCPRTETTHGSFTVNLDPHSCRFDPRSVVKEIAHQCFTRSPKDSKHIRV